MNPDMPNLAPDLLLEHVDGMRRLAQRLVRDPALAEDVAQDAVLVALSKGPRNRRNIRGWLNGIVRNVARESHRSAQRRARHEGAAPTPDAAPDPLHRMAQIAEHKRLLDAVETLPEPYRETVWQRYFEERKPRAIAREAGIPVETVRTRLKRAHALLRTKLDQAHDGDRRAWALALAPLGMSGGSRALPSLIGGALVTTKTKVGALVALVLLAAGSAWWIAVTQQGTGDVEPSALPLEGTAEAGPEASAPRLRGSGPAPGAVAAEPAAGTWRIAGKTLGPADEPLVDVEVRAAPPEVQDIDAMPVVARSQADGTFVFAASGDAENLRVVASAPGRLDALALRRREDAIPLALILPTVPTYVFRMLDGTTDKPLVGVTCSLRRKAGTLLWERVVRSDEAGVVVVPSPTADVLEDKLAVIVRHQGYRTLMQLPRPRDSSRARPRDIYLFPAPHLVLEARDPEGHPVPGVRVRAWAGRPSLSTAAPEWRMDTLRFWADGTGHGVALGDALTDEAGRVVFDMGPENLTWFAYAAADGLAGMAHGSATWRNRDAHEVIKLETTARIVGRVTDAAGQPVARARVAYTPWAIAEAMKKGGRVSVPPDECSRHWETMTDAAGEYELAAVPLPAAPAEVFLDAIRGDLGMAHVAVRAGAKPNETQRIDLVLASEYETATLHVVDEQERPIAGALVTLANVQPGMLTDETGSARLLLYPGVDGRFRAYKRGYVIGSAEPSKDKGAVTITLGLAHALRGRVLDRDGEPRGAYVDVYDPKVADLPENERNQVFTDLWFGRAHADAGGHFRLDELPAGPYFVRAWYSTLRGGEHHTVIAEQHVAGDDPVELRLPEAEPPEEPTGVLAGTVVGADGEPLTAYGLSLQNPRGSSGPDRQGSPLPLRGRRAGHMEAHGQQQRREAEDRAECGRAPE